MMTDWIRETANSIVNTVLFSSMFGCASFFGMGFGGLIISFFDHTNPPFIGFYAGGIVWFVLIQVACAFGLCCGLIGSHTHGRWEEKNRNTIDMIVNFWQCDAP